MDALLHQKQLPSSTSLKREELLKSVLFESPTKNAQSIAVSVGKGETAFNGLVKVNPKEVILIDSEHAVLITENQPLELDGTPQTAHVSGALIGAYFFNRTKNQTWQLDKRMDGIDSVGVFGAIGKTNVSKLSEGQYTFSVTNGSCWQGSCINWISIYGIAKNQLQIYLPLLTISASNVGSSPEVCSSIEAAIQANQNSIKKPSSDIEDHDRNCFDIKGKHLIRASDGVSTKLIISFAGYEAEWIQKTNTFSLEEVDTQNTYELIDGKFKLTQGIDPLNKESRRI